MTNSIPLSGIELVDCARANAKHGLAIASQQCGYDKDYQQFESELQKACKGMGIELDDFTDLLKEAQNNELGVEISPNSATQF
jgi:hypothetical protein